MAVYIFSIVSILLLVFYGFAIRVLIRERKGMLLLGCSLLNVLAGFANGLIHDMIMYTDKVDMTQWQMQAYSFFAGLLYYSCLLGLAAVIVNAVLLHFQRQKPD